MSNPTSKYCKNVDCKNDDSSLFTSKIEGKHVYFKCALCGTGFYQKQAKLNSQSSDDSDLSLSGILGNPTSPGVTNVKPGFHGDKINRNKNYKQSNGGNQVHGKYQHNRKKMAGKGDINTKGDPVNASQVSLRDIQLDDKPRSPPNSLEQTSTPVYPSFRKRESQKSDPKKYEVPGSPTKNRRYEHHPQQFNARQRSKISPHELDFDNLNMLDLSHCKGPEDYNIDVSENKKSVKNERPKDYNIDVSVNKKSEKNDHNDGAENINNSNCWGKADIENKDVSIYSQTSVYHHDELVSLTHKLKLKTEVWNTPCKCGQVSKDGFTFENDKYDGEILARKCRECNDVIMIDDTMDSQDLKSLLQNCKLRVKKGKCGQCNNDDLNKITFEIDEHGEYYFKCACGANLGNDMEAFASTTDMNPMASASNSSGDSTNDATDIETDEDCDYAECINCHTTASIESGFTPYYGIYADICRIECKKCEQSMRLKAPAIECRCGNKYEDKFIILDEGGKSMAVCQSPGCEEITVLYDETTPSDPSIHEQGFPNARTKLFSTDQLRKGDHIAWHQRLGYWHHGVVKDVAVTTGKVKVIHYIPKFRQLIKGAIEEEFLKLDFTEDDLYRIDYNPSDCYPPDEVIRRAESRIGEKKYNLITNNCEHFSRWCKTGKHRSLQEETFWDVCKRSGRKIGSRVAKDSVRRSVKWATTGLTVSETGMAGSAVTKGLRFLDAAGIMIIVGLEVHSTVKDIKKYTEVRQEGGIERNDYINMVVKRVSRGVGAAAGASLGGIIGQLIVPIPVVGGFIGASLGSIMGNVSGTLAGRTICTVKDGKKPTSP